MDRLVRGEPMPLRVITRWINIYVYNISVYMDHLPFRKVDSLIRGMPLRVITFVVIKHPTRQFRATGEPESSANVLEISLRSF